MTPINTQELSSEKSGFYTKVDSRVGVTHSLARTLAGSSYSARNAIEQDAVSILSPIKSKRNLKVQ